MKGRDLLERFSRTWKKRKAVEVFLQALSVTLLVGVLSFYWLPSLLWILGVSLLVFLLAFFFFFYASGIRSISPAYSARYLNKEVPALEYSSALFLQKRENLNLPERLQYSRMEQVLSALPIPSPPVLIGRAVTLFCLSLFVSAGVLWWSHLQTPLSIPQGKLPEAFQAATEANLQGPNQAPSLTEGNILISPPAYTGQRSYEAALAAAEAPKGSNLRWKVHFSDRIIKAWLSLSEGDSIPFQPGGKGSFLLNLKLEENLLYQLIWEDKNRNTGVSDFYRLEAVPDQSPFVQLEEPEPYKRSATPAPFPVEVLLEDDYGLTAAYLQLTISSGSGEGVSFTAHQLPFDHDFKGKNKKLKLRKVLDPNLLEMEMGDELYYHVVVFDNHHPQRQQSRSETYYFQWEDTAAVSSFEMEGMAMDMMPEYFRSQRQIIIDTEKLLAEQSAITDQEFEKRANNLGVDQKLLRLRYGKFLGEEFESGYGQEVLPEEGEGHEPAGEGEGEGEGEGPHQHEEDHQEGPPTAENLLSEFMHAHDTEEGATFYEESIKIKLKAALAEMWASELRLRTLKPAKALPFQYRALEIIKEVQQATRVYVERIGFEPPPLKPMEKRLTGNQEEVRSGYRTTFIPSTDSLGAIREVITFLKGNSKGRLEEEQLRVLREAGNSLAAIAAQHPKSEHLEGLKLINGLLNGQELGKAVRQHLLHALLEALPPADFTPQAPQLYRSQLEQSFMEKIGGTGE